ncbi:MAG: 16S rRNA (guanine(527)-N(7))-methyltransferase RsmG [Firmicutes bacterium]|nr:16S rRNA (guanine(527)-N(7))-methyltransferase RsmG [Bacillota bacterium]
MEAFIDPLQRGVKALGLNLTGEQIAGCAAFCEILLSENRKVNLTSITGRAEIAVKHFLDSLTCLNVLELKAGTEIIDVGTGAGFPGYPIKICRPEVNLTLLESVEKKAAFLAKVKRELKLGNVYLVKGRAEEAGRDGRHRERYDVAVARAVAEMSVLAEYCLPLVKIGGYFLAMKGPAAAAEIEEARSAIEILGGRVSRLISLKLPITGEGRCLVLIEKVAATPEKYPRRPGVPKKSPLGEKPGKS